MLDSLTAIVQALMRPARYYAQHPAAVLSQHDDDTVDVLPDDATLRGNGLSNVPIRHGLPGVRVRVVAGSRVLLGFEGGDPARPYVSLWDAASVEKILFNGGTAGLARIGDLVTIYWPVLDCVGTLNNSPAALTMIPALPSPGIIQTGSSKVLAGP